MTMIVRYPSKKELKAHIGQPLRYIAFFGAQYKDNGMIVVCNRPHITRIGREFFAEVTMADGLIKKVS